MNSVARSKSLRLRYAASRGGLDRRTADRLRVLASLVEQHDPLTVGLVHEALWPTVTMGSANKNLRRLRAALRRGGVTLRPKVAGLISLSKPAA